MHVIDYAKVFFAIGEGVLKFMGNGCILTIPIGMRSRR